MAGMRGGRGKSKATASETKAVEGTQPLQVAGKRGGKGKAAETRRKRKAVTSEIEVVDFNNEDYNIPSPERTKLLTEIKGVIGNVPVSPALWACCQLADMHCLKALTKWEGDAILGYEDSLAVIALKWCRRFQDSQVTESEDSEVTESEDSEVTESEDSEVTESETASQRLKGSKKRKLNSDGQLPVLWSAKEAENCKERDGRKCVLTQMSDPKAAHIFPYSLLNPPAEHDGVKASDMIPDFWKPLPLFWDKDRVQKWHNKIFPGPQNVGVERCFNQISLEPSAYSMWTRGVFALKPLKLSTNRKKLTVQFFWQVPSSYKIKSRIDLLTEPASSRGLEVVKKGSGGYFLTRFENNGSISCIRSGETFTFTTKDPENLPLPSLELLEMQWVLQRLVGMSGAAEWPSLDDDDDDSAD